MLPNLVNYYINHTATHRMLLLDLLLLYPSHTPRDRSLARYARIQLAKSSALIYCLLSLRAL